MSWAGSRVGVGTAVLAMLAIACLMSGCGGMEEDSFGNLGSAASAYPEGYTPVEVVPLFYDYDEVEIGDSDLTIITVTNIGFQLIYITDLYFQDGSSPDFALSSTRSSRDPLMPGETIEIQATFSPSDAGPESAVLVIDMHNGSAIGPVPVLLQGIGSVSESSFLARIEEIIRFFDQAVEDGLLEGTGHGCLAWWRVKIFRMKLEIARWLIEHEHLRAACYKLMTIYRRTDGERRPHDFVEGDAAPELAEMIADLMADMECGEDPGGGGCGNHHRWGGHCHGHHGHHHHRWGHHGHRHHGHGCGHHEK